MLHSLVQRAVPAAGLIASLIGPPLDAQAAPAEYRPAIIVTLPQWHGVRVFLHGEEHLTMQDLGQTERIRGVGLASPSYQYGSVASGSVAVELREVRHASGTIEHRWFPTLTSVVALGQGVELRNRARMELRDIAGTWSQRYRDRATLARPIGAFGVTPVPFVHYEVSYDTRFAVLNRREAAAGITIPIARGTAVDSFLMRQTDTRRAYDVLIAAGMILRVTL